MPDQLAGFPPRFLRTPEAARFLSLSGRTLEKHRTYGTGPKYRKIGGRVVYALEDLKAWADLAAKTSTSDPGIGTVSPARRRDHCASATLEIEGLQSLEGESSLQRTG
jgi:predicted DNA-binding transcriptional regulator AlpA